MITWSISTKPCPIITWDGVVFNGEHLYVDHICLYDSCSTFRPKCSEAISAHARLVKFNLSILRVQNWLAPIVCERRAYHTRSSRGVSARRIVATVHTQGEHLYLWSKYNATDILREIRCIKDKHHMQSKYVTWYGHHHLVPLISISKAPSWSPSSPAWHLDLHRSIIVVSPNIATTTIATA